MKTINDKVLSDRENMILNYIVESYVQTAIPVGSRYLAKKYKLGISPATVRNVMNDLEDLGFLSQPHVSAGRVPTDKGYRFYVDCLISFNKIKKKDRIIICDNLTEYSSDVKEILEAASRVLGKVSSQLGVVLEPRFYQGIFQKMDLVSVSENRILAVISIQSGLVKTIMMEIESQVPPAQLQEAYLIINERLAGLSLKEVKETIDKRLSDTTVPQNRIIRLVLASSNRLFNFESHEGLHLGGTSNFIANPEFSDQTYMTKIMGLIESKESLLSKFEQGEDEKITVSIGHENKEDLLRGCSVIATKYFVGNVSGALGVVGPTRMPYARIIPLVDYMGDTLTKMLTNKVH